jgi:hypothetical protein
MNKDEEIAKLRNSLSILRNEVLRMCCRVRDSEGRATVDEVVHIKRSSWQKAFDPLIVPPYNLLYWENET